MLAVDEDQPLMAEILQLDNLADQLLVVERPADGRAQRPAEAAVLAVVDAVVPDIKRREQDDSIPVDIALEPAGGGKDLLDQFRRLGGQKRGGLLERERLLFERLGDDLAHTRLVVPLAGQTGQKFVVDEIDRVRGDCMFHQHGSVLLG